MNRHLQYIYGTMVSQSNILLDPLWLPFNLDDYRFVHAAAFRHPQKVYNVVPGDFTQDGRLDILVVSQSSSASELDIQVYVALPDGGFGGFIVEFVFACSSYIPVRPRGYTRAPLC